MAFNNKKIAVIIPAFNEEQSIALVVTELANLKYHNEPLIDDIIVCDNASTDKTASLAKNAGARVVSETKQGYGAACLKGIASLKYKAQEAPDYVVFADGDYSANANELIMLLRSIQSGADLVVGTRENPQLKRGAMGIHQRLGNRLATFLIRLLWQTKVSDLGPFRIIRYSRLMELNMQDQAFGWTVEMQVKTIQAGFVYREIPVSTRRRLGKSKISGTISGTIGAAKGIFSKIFQLYWHEKEFIASLNGLNNTLKSRNNIL